MAGLQTDDAVFAGLHEAKKDELEMKKYDEGSDFSDGGHDGNKAHDGLTFATEEDRLTLRHIPDRIPWASYREDNVIVANLRLSDHFHCQSSLPSKWQSDSRTTEL